MNRQRKQKVYPYKPVRKLSRATSVARLLQEVVPESSVRGWGFSIKESREVEKSVASLFTNSNMVDMGMYEKLGFSVSVNYHTPINRLIEWGRFDEVNQNLPLFDCAYSSLVIDRIFYPICFLRKLESERVKEALSKMGLRPANLQELLHVGIRFPGAQLTKTIVALGTDFTEGGYTIVPMLVGSETYRSIMVGISSLVWKPSTCFLATRFN